MLGAQSVMKWGRKRPIVYFATSVIKTVMAAPKPKIPIWNIEGAIARSWTRAAKSIAREIKMQTLALTCSSNEI